MVSATGGPRPDRGAATVAAVALCTVLAVGLLVVGQIGRAVILTERTSAAADVTALAAAVAILRLDGDPCAVSARIALRNAVRQVSCSISHPAAGAEVVVVVRSERAVWPIAVPQERSRAGLRPKDPG